MLPCTCAEGATKQDTMSIETGLPDAVAAALRSGNKIEAIRLLRAQTGTGLKQAKWYFLR